MTTIRRAVVDDAPALAEVLVAAWRETYRDMLPQTLLDDLSPSIRAERWRRILSAASRPRIYVAEQEGWTVGFVDGGRCRGDGLTQDMEVYELYLLDAVKRQGIGGRLLRTIFDDFVERGATSAGVWVLRDNDPARRFYESFGAEPVAERVERRPGYELFEVGYAWHDLKRAFLR